VCVRVCVCSMFSSFFNEILGNCYTFNSGWNATKVRASKKTGPRHGQCSERESVKEDWSKAWSVLRTRGHQRRLVQGMVSAQNVRRASKKTGPRHGQCSLTIDNKPCISDS